MNAKQRKFFYLESAHGGWLSVNRMNGAICHVRCDATGFCSENGEKLYVPLLCVVLPQWPDYAFLTTEPSSDDKHPPLVIWMEKFPYRGTILPFRRIKTVENGDRAGLENIFTQERFCTTHLWTHDKTAFWFSEEKHEGANRVLADCSQLQGWEEFKFHSVDLGGRMETLEHDLQMYFQPTIDFLELKNLIFSYEGKYLLYLLDAMFPFMRHNDMAHFSEIFLSEENLVQTFTKKIGCSHWSQVIIDTITWQRNGRPVSKGDLSCDKKWVNLTYAGMLGAPEGFVHMLLHHIRRGIKPDKKLCILATVRNEGIYLLEWIAYHRSIGVEHFFLYSNDNNDNSEELLKSLHEEGIITYVNNKVMLGSSAQLQAYGHALNVLPDILNYDWCFILDGDEFITISPNYKKIQNYLREMERWEVDGIAINWQFIASEPNKNGFSDLIKPLTQRNLRILSQDRIGEGWRLVKSACRPNKVLQARPHHPYWWYGMSFAYRMANGDLHEFRNPPPQIGREPGFADYGSFDKIYISHYYYKSFVEWIWKYARNSGLDDATEFGIERYADYWAVAYVIQQEDTSTALNENLILRDVGMLNELERLRQIPSVRRAENLVRQAWEERMNNLLDMIENEDVKSRILEEWHHIFDFIPIERQGQIPLHS